jgi:hypothetical protein
VWNLVCADGEFDISFIRPALPADTPSLRSTPVAFASGRSLSPISLM